MEEIKWTVTQANGNVSRVTAKKLPFVSAWKTFSKIEDEAEKERVFNAMRGALISSELMENGK